MNRSLKENLDNITRLLFELRTKADLDVYLGLLALENGRSERIGDVFRRALDIWGRPEKGAHEATLDFRNRQLALYYLHCLEDSKWAQH